MLPFYQFIVLRKEKYRLNSNERARKYNKETVFKKIENGKTYIN